MDPWPYFSLLLDDALNLGRIVSFTSDNLECYGDKFSELIIMSGIELETVARSICQTDPFTINTLKGHLESHCPGIIDLEYRIDSMPGLKVAPFPHLDADVRYEWWATYTALKHNRHASITQATLQAMWQSLAAHFTVCLLHSRNTGWQLKEWGGRVFFGTNAPIVRTVYVPVDAGSLRTDIYPQLFGNHEEIFQLNSQYFGDTEVDK